jgi:hypothetical protein
MTEQLILNEEDSPSKPLDIDLINEVNLDQAMRNTLKTSNQL